MLLLTQQVQHLPLHLQLFVRQCLHAEAGSTAESLLGSDIFSGAVRQCYQLLQTLRGARAGKPTDLPVLWSRCQRWATGGVCASHLGSNLPTTRSGAHRWRAPTAAACELGVTGRPGRSRCCAAAARGANLLAAAVVHPAATAAAAATCRAQPDPAASLQPGVECPHIAWPLEQQDLMADWQSSAGC